MLALIASGACADGSDALAATADPLRLPGAFQFVAGVPFSTALESRFRGGSLTWTPPIDTNDPRLISIAHAIEAPDTVRAGVAVEIVVNTIGENGCWGPDGGTLDRQANTVTIVAFDRHSGAPACTDIWNDRLAHRFTTAFPTPGAATIRAHGRRIQPALSRGPILPVSVERAVVVVP